MTAEWQRENPGHDDVAGVRLSAYAKYRPGSSTAASGLFAMLRGASETADTAVLLGDRALYATKPGYRISCGFTCESPEARSSLRPSAATNAFS